MNKDYTIKPPCYEEEKKGSMWSEINITRGTVARNEFEKVSFSDCRL